jgi:DNA-binding MarR family transcriptional regulator
VVLVCLQKVLKLKVLSAYLKLFSPILSRFGKPLTTQTRLFVPDLKDRQANLPVYLFSSTAYSQIVMCSTKLDTAVIDFAHAVALLTRRVRAASAAHGLSWTESAVMGRLAKDGPATTAALARAEGMKPQSMGATIAALEHLGLVERKPHPADGRQINIALTDQGVAVRKIASDAKRMWLLQAIAQLNEQDQETLFAAGKIIERLVEK